MSDLISRDLLTSHLNECLADTDGNTPIVDGVITAIKCAVEQMPAVDAVPVVRCKDCKRSLCEKMDNETVYCPALDVFMKQNDFCSYGERKSNQLMNTKPSRPAQWTLLGPASTLKCTPCMAWLAKSANSIPSIRRSIRVTNSTKNTRKRSWETSSGSSPNTAAANGWDLNEIMQLNIDKLRARYPDGFSADHSLHRAEGDI